MLLPKLLHELEQTILLGLQSLYPLTLGLPLGPLSLPLSQQTLLLIPWALAGRARGEEDADNGTGRGEEDAVSG